MLLFQKRFHAGLKSGEVTLTFRHWHTPRVKVGGRYRCHPIGVLEVDEINRVQARDITEQDARKAGFPSREELFEYLSDGRELNDETQLFRVVLHHGGDGDRVAIALDDALSSDDVEAITKKLARLDKNGPWTMQTLRIIEQHPQVAARILAKKMGRDRDPFKVDVRKLKRLGLTQSFEIGYEISPRGRAYLAAIGK
ncbi:MAG: ASCH domain-containing protein [Myxococcales bacterium]|nr:ASCH domain-containing protein [Myxococcales bacterium]MDD9968835.1 ASCH domain-containing protein [Myxococcales bacterium]